MQSKCCSVFQGRSYPDFFPAPRLRFGWVTSHLSLFPVTNNVTLHICHISGKNVTLSHTKIFFSTCDVLSHLSRKTSHFGPAGTKLFETGRNVTIRMGLKHSYLFPSQICHLSRKREAGRPFGLRSTLSVFQCVECVVVCYIVNISRATAISFDQISLRGSVQCVCCSVL